MPPPAVFYADDINLHVSEKNLQSENLCSKHAKLHTMASSNINNFCNPDKKYIMSVYLNFC